jgi:hypothetical protein
MHGFKMYTNSVSAILKKTNRWIEQQTMDNDVTTMVEIPIVCGGDRLCHQRRNLGVLQNSVG